MTERLDSVEIPVRDDATEFRAFDRAPMVLAALAGIGVSPAGKRVVDLGAGFGSLSLACASIASSVVAVDIHPDRIAAINARSNDAGLKVEARVADLLQQTLGDVRADMAFMFGVAEYAGLWNLSEDVAALQGKVFRSAFDSLRPGGKLVFGSKNRAWIRFLARDANTGQPLVNALPRRAADLLSRRMSGKPYRQHIHTPNGWSKLIEAAGFTNVKTFSPYLSYQFPVKIVSRPSLRDAGELKRLNLSPDARRVAWGKLGMAKARFMGIAGVVGIPMTHSVIVVAEKP